MNEASDALKVRARSELEKIHKGLVVGMESRSSGKLAASASEAGSNPNRPDVSLAIDMVNEALDTLDALKDLAARQQSELEGTGKNMIRLREELDSSQRKVADLQSQLAPLRLENQKLSKALASEQEEIRKVRESQKRTDHDLGSLIEVITNSFRKGARNKEGNEA